MQMKIMDAELFQPQNTGKRSEVLPGAIIGRPANGF